MSSRKYWDDSASVGSTASYTNPPGAEPTQMSPSARWTRPEVWPARFHQKTACSSVWDGVTYGAPVSQECTSEKSMPSPRVGSVDPSLRVVPPFFITCRYLPRLPARWDGAYTR